MGNIGEVDLAGVAEDLFSMWCSREDRWPFGALLYAALCKGDLAGDLLGGDRPEQYRSGSASQAM
jgi:hypothetical protein